MHSLCKSLRAAVSELDSYRQIFLTSCVAKVMERLLENTLYHLAESCGLLCDAQGEFCTDDQVLHLTRFSSLTRPENHLDLL